MRICNFPFKKITVGPLFHSISLPDIYSCSPAKTRNFWQWIDVLDPVFLLLLLNSSKLGFSLWKMGTSLSYHEICLKCMWIHSWIFCIFRATADLLTREGSLVERRRVLVTCLKNRSEIDRVGKIVLRLEKKSLECEAAPTVPGSIYSAKSGCFRNLLISLYCLSGPFTRCSQSAPHDWQMESRTSFLAVSPVAFLIYSCLNSCDSDKPTIKINGQGTSETARLTSLLRRKRTTTSRDFQS